MNDINSSINFTKPEPGKYYRWLILIFVSLAMFGNYYIYDSISPLADVLSKQLNFTDSDIGLLVGIYSVPNIFMVLIGGIIIDRYGTRVSTFVFTALCLFGAVITAFSGGELFWMAVGRLVFGLGAESMIVGITTVLGRWFKGKELSFAFGLNLTIARLGSFSALNSPTWAKSLYISWQGPLLLTVAAATLSLASVIIYWGMDAYAEKNYKVRSVPKQEEFRFKQIFSFSKSFWYIVLLCVTFYSAIFPFETFAIKFFIDVHHVSRSSAGFQLSMLKVFAMVFSPLFGLLSDYIGKRSLMMMIGSALLIPVYLMMAYTHVSLYIPMAMMGIAFSLIPAVMWPSVAIITDESKLGTAYGLMTLIQNIGLAGFNFLIGWANDFSSGYNLGMWIFSILGFLGVLFAFLLRKNELGPSGQGLELGIKEVK
ncbi:putative sulfoacetate transporter SauU [bacterium BMS3Abin04]|nr:putative sulfoacetate transporter SauU [bacterium BMS3Abin04]